MKRHQRKHVLDLNSDSSRKKQNKYHQSNEQMFKQDNGVASNPLSNLLEQYNSDSEDEDNKHIPVNPGRQLDQKVDDFLKEIQYINPNATTPINRPVDGTNVDKDNSIVQEPASLWQECFDESTGYSYYWHVETNQVTWEIPKELELYKNKIDRVSSPRPGFDPQRNFPSKTYPEMQSNIPEGMIPKEVVARNRNRQVNLPSSSKKYLDNKNKSLNDSKDDDINDGKIEMITSFGSDGSDESNVSEEEENNSKVSIVASLSVDSKPVVNTKKRKRVKKMGPKLPDNNYDIVANGNEEEEKEEEKEEEEEESNNPSLDNDDKSNESSVDDKEFKFSLVPGYADDSENEDDCTNNKPPQVSTLFPISNYTEKELKTFTTIEKTEVVVQNIDSVDSSPAAADDDNSAVIKPEDNNITKVNIFLENSEAPAKRYQRKQRIAFDVMPNKNKVSTEAENNYLGNSNSNSNSSINSSQNNNKTDLIRSNDERLGFGFPKRPPTPDTSKPSTSTEEQSTDSPVDKSESGINFVRGETLNLSPKSQNENEEKNDESDRISTKNETETILEKLKFLSEGCQVPSAVQVMTIQLQTLLGAWEAGDLKNRYLDNWLTGTSRELCRLEKAAAPSGWDCQWDRSHKRYYYRNESTDEVRWNYPDVIGGAEEMELCTTPPPQDEEDFDDDKSCNLLQQEMTDNNAGDHKQKIGVVETEEVANKRLELNNKLADKEALSEIKQDNGEANTPVPPPPPQISSPSPPPPPKIFADDLKQGKKRRVNELNTSFTTGIKKEKISTDTDQSLRIEDTIKNIQQTLSHPLIGPVHAEPLPPGVDSPEISYPLAGAPLEQTVIFTTTPHQQPNASLYAAAALQDPNIMGHHHQALLQSQLVHYPTYHQHLHNQAILAAANRLTGQETVQFVLDFPRMYTNTQVIAKPPIKTSNETMGSALDSFYSDIASLERPPIETKPVEATIQNVPNLTEDRPQPSSTPISLSSETDKTTNDAIITKEKEKKKKKAKIGISKKQKQVSSMVAKWQKAQNYEDTN